ncbi:MAG: hypothetical protein WC349_01140 [Patescibacteria group bacterium]|jgi:phosphoribosylcarboxyaminoimidazole (NCAIR) mutase
MLDKHVKVVVIVDANTEKDLSNHGAQEVVEKTLQNFKIPFKTIILATQEQSHGNMKKIVAGFEECSCKIFIALTNDAITLAKIVATHTTKSFAAAMPTETEAQIMANKLCLSSYCAAPPKNSATDKSKRIINFVTGILGLVDLAPREALQEYLQNQGTS